MLYVDLQLSGIACVGASQLLFFLPNSRLCCQHIDQLLWKAEVDLENVEDMYLRLGRVPCEGRATTSFTIPV